MASVFRIVYHRNGDSLHLKLMGDFNALSAHRLSRALRTHCGNAGKIYINTSSLSCLHPSGLDLFQKNCTVHNLNHALTFTGELGNLLAPEGSRCI